MRKNCRVQRFFCTALLLSLFPFLSGCQETDLVIEKVTLVIEVPKDSKEIRLLYLFEGISVLDLGRLEQAQRQMDSRLSFYFYSLDPDEFPSLDRFDFKAPRFFLDPARKKRKLCAYCSVSASDREKFAKQLNEDITQLLKAPFELDKTRPNWIKTRASIFGALLKLGATLGRVLPIDDQSRDKVRRAIDQQAFQWIRLEPDTISVCFPITVEYAKRIVGDPRSKRWLEETQLLPKRFQLKAGDDGLTLILGNKGQPIRLEISDARPHNPELEENLIRYADNPLPLSIDGKVAGTEKLIDVFQAKVPWDAFRAQEKREIAFWNNVGELSYPDLLKQKPQLLLKMKDAPEGTKKLIRLIQNEEMAFFKALEKLRYPELLKQKPQLLLKMQDDPGAQKKLLALIENHKAKEELARKLAQKQAEAERLTKATSKLQIAKAFLQDYQEYEAKGKGKEADAIREIAARRLQEVIDMFPDTKAAEEARGLLKKLKKAGR